MQHHLEGCSLTAHAAFFPKGLAFTSPSAGTIAQDTWPDESDTLWNNTEYQMPVMENFKVAMTANEDVIRSGFPGGLGDLDVIEVGKELKITADAVQPSALMFQLLFGGYTGTGNNLVQSTTTSLTPLKGKAILKGILAFNAYDEDHSLVLSGNIWVAVKKTNEEPWSGANKVKGTVDIRALISNNNAISTPSAA